MISHLKGIVSKGSPGEATVDVNGVGYKISMPLNEWDEILDGSAELIQVSTYVREDRFELFGFIDPLSRRLFEDLIQLNGIGPRMGLELCAVPRSMLLSAVDQNDAAVLTAIKGIGRKTAEKLLLELKSLAEKHPEVFASVGGTMAARFDADTVAALTQLGFSTPDVLKVLEQLPKDLTTTEDRVTAALRNL